MLCYLYVILLSMLGKPQKKVSPLVVRPLRGKGGYVKAGPLRKYNFSKLKKSS